MSLRVRLFIALCSMAGLCLLVMFDIVTGELKPAMRRAVEETLIDTSIMLAEMAKPDLQQGELVGRQFLEALGKYTKVRPNALVWGVQKRKTDHRIYITDAQGIVLYDSNNGQDEGKDYSSWNDVYLTLRGRYGARSSPSSPGGTSVMYVAAPIYDHDRTIVGVLSVGKPVASIEPYFIKSRAEILHASVLLFLFAVLGALFLTWIHGRDVSRLVAYADSRASGHQTHKPKLVTLEMKRLGNAVEKMGLELEGKVYIEQYVDSLTHELKSPLSAIAGAVEILASPTSDQAARQRFLGHIKNENKRMQQIVERLLHLAFLENQGSPNKPAWVDLAEMLHALIANAEARISSTDITVHCQLPKTLMVYGEAFLIRQALDNLWLNALDFTPHGGTICIQGTHDSGVVSIEIINTGSPIPDYALGRVFERFYSLPRASGKKSTGLGLPFTRGVALLHGGDVRLENCDKGVRAIFHLAAREV